MLKSCGIQVRREDITHAQYMEHWLNVHAPMSKKVKRLYGYVNNEVVADITPHSWNKMILFSEIDGIAQIWFDQPDGLMGLAASDPNVPVWFQDGPNFVGNRMGMTTDEHVLLSPGKPRPAGKVFLFLEKKEGKTYQDIQNFIVRMERIPEVKGLTLSEVLSGNASANLPTFEMPDIDAIGEVWASDQEKIKALINNGEMQTFFASEESPIKKGCILLVNEIVTREPVEAFD